MRDEVDYFYYLERGDDKAIEAQAAEAIDKDYNVFYLKVGLDGDAEGTMLDTLRRAIGPHRKIRIDANQAWTLPEARQRLAEWHRIYNLDFVEAPVSIDPIENFSELKHAAMPAICVNEGLWRAADAYRIIKARIGHYLCYSPFWVGSLARFHMLNWAAHLEGWLVCKHTHGELGLAAAAGHHLMLAAPNASDGNQQTAQLMTGDILTQDIPIRHGPKWGRLEGPGLGVQVDENKLMTYYEDFLRDGEFAPYGDRFGS